MKTPNKASKTNNTSKKSSSDKIETDIPLSEKDEVKNAEKRTNKAMKDRS